MQLKTKPSFLGFLFGQVRLFLLQRGAMGRAPGPNSRAEGPSIPDLLLLLLSLFSRVRLCATPETAAHQVPPFLGFSRQEHWRNQISLPLIGFHWVT